MAQFNFKAIGTTWKIDIFDQISVTKQSDILSRVMARIDIFDKAYSRFRNDSLVTQISNEAGSYSMPSDADMMMSVYYDLYLKTGGFFTPLVGRLLSDAGYDANYSLSQKGKLEIPPAWDDVIEYRSTEHVLIAKKPVLLDFGAAGKGYLIDLVGEVLRSNGIVAYCIDAGGDILFNDQLSIINDQKKTKTIRVGLEDPDDANKVIGVYELGSQSICGSAGNRRAWGDFTHIMNPKTMVSPTEIIAVWVVANQAIIADALTTCLFFVKPETLADAYKFEYFILYKDRSFEKSVGFDAEIFG